MIERLFENYWRKKVAEEVKQLIDSNHEINAYGIYLYIKNKVKDA